MKKRKASTAISVLLLALGLLTALGLVSCSKAAQRTSAQATLAAAGDPEEYYMITFMSGLEYWKSCYQGFQDAAKVFGVSTVYTGAQQFDINQQVTVLEQVASKKPAGITITCVNAEALVKPINKVIDSGIPLIIFDSDSSNSKRPSIVQTGNVRAGNIAADVMAADLGEEGNVAVLLTPGTPTLEQRAAGFKAEIAAKYPKMKVVASGNYDGSETSSAKTAAGIIAANPDLRGFFAGNSPGSLGAATAVREAGRKGKTIVVGFDADTALLDKIKAGEIAASVAQGSYNQGYWAMIELYLYKHKLMNPIKGWEEHGMNPLPPYIDTGVFVIKKDNADLFYSK